MNLLSSTFLFLCLCIFDFRGSELSLMHLSDELSMRWPLPFSGPKVLVEWIITFSKHRDLSSPRPKSFHPSRSLVVRASDSFKVFDLVSGAELSFILLKILDCFFNKLFSLSLASDFVSLHWPRLLVSWHPVSLLSHLLDFLNLIHDHHHLGLIRCLFISNACMNLWKGSWFPNSRVAACIKIKCLRG